MRGRSHRFQSVDPHDDWVDGSWTVDCVCGVTFDDGEEMVNCDECGVWVHTRCSKYVKGEESFACDKCKSKNNRFSRHNDSEETEVAQLLVELPTKTVRLESSYSGPATARRPIRLWTDIPMENRVHVQGIPGGDPELFNGLSSVFTPELWKCTGYVPKKFNFQYREFPCWDDKEGSHRKEEENDNENENPVDKGAGMLFSLSKESVLTTPMAAFIGVRGREECGFEGKMLSKEMKWEAEGVDVRHSQNGIKKERSLLRHVVVHSGKRKKEDKDRSGKKKARALEEEAVERKKGLHASRTVCRPIIDAKQLEFYEDRGLKSSKTDIQGVKNKNLQEDAHREPVSDGHLAVDTAVNRPMNNIATNDCPLDGISSDVSRHFSNGAVLTEDMTSHQVPVSIKSSPTTNDIAGSILEQNDAQNISLKQERDSMDIDKLDDTLEASARSTQKPFVEDVASVAPEVGDSQILKDISGDTSLNFVSPNVEVKMEVDNDNSRGNLNFQSSPGDAKVQNSSYDHTSESFKVNDLAASSSQSNDQKAQDTEKTSDVVGDCHIDKADDPCHIKQEPEGLVDPVEAQRSSPESKQNSGIAEEQSKSEGSSLSSPAQISHQKMVVSGGKSVSISSNTVVSKSSASENLKRADTQNSNLHSKQRVTSESKVSVKKDRAVSDVVRDEEKHDIFRKSVKEHSKSSVNALSKVSHSNRILHATVSRRTVSDSKDSVPSSSSKSSVQNVAIASGSGESTGSLQSQCALHVQNKISTSGLRLRGEKLNQSNIQPPPKVSHAQPMHPPAASNSLATLSDEELALLLHQELNSSPRVPRVPRVRQAGSLPQLSSPTTTSTLMKRTSSSGLKDHSLVSKRKNKDASKDGFRSSRELDDEARKVEKVQSSPDLRRQDIGYAVDVYTKREDNGSSTAVHSVKKNMPSVLANSGPSSSAEANDHNVSSVHYSPRNVSDDDTGSNRGPVHRTLPGLINDIMSKGRRMTYEELCNAVLPHWPHLRKHNGERYAYSSHSQAVLDCLRNRHEWARLVDRGPKTNSSRKRRKLDADESEDNEYGNGRRTTKEVESKSLESQREEFPKGKRKARKRRRLALQGRGIKDVRKRRKADLPSDDDTGLFSNSSEDSMFSEDETHGGGACPAGSEASASSDEAGTS